MTDTNDHIASIKILDRTYQVKCPPDEIAQLQESAACLDEQMRKMRQTGASTVNSMERLAIVTALNLCRELTMYKKQNNTYIDVVHDQIKLLQNRIQKFLETKEEILA